jgi:hypothetical protein
MLIAVGGNSRSVGKTSVMCGIIQGAPEAHWLAIKITQYGHSVCNRDGEPCECAPKGLAHPYALDEQTAADETDSGRYLAAGAHRSYWLRTAQGDLGHALPVLKELLTGARHVIVESNSILRFFEPGLYVAVLDFSNADMKDSARLYMDRAGAIYLKSPEVENAPWKGVPRRWINGKPCFSDIVELAQFVRERLD